MALGLEMVADGYVAVTPLYLDLTLDQGLEGLAGRFVGQKRSVEILSPTFTEYSTGPLPCSSSCQSAPA